MERNVLVVKYGAYTFGIVILFAILSQFIGASLDLIQNITILALAAEIYLCCNEYKRKIEYNLDFKKAFSLGWQVSFIAGLINSIFVFIIIKLAGQQTLLDALQQYKMVWMQKGGLDEKSFDELAHNIVNPWFLFTVTNIIYLIMGFVLSIIIAFFAKTTTASNEE